MLSMYVKNSVRNNKQIYFHTITKKYLPVDCSEQDLHQGFFLKGQERDAILSVFAKPHSSLSLIICPTWECNLRCKHCSVINNLKLKEEEVFPVEKLIKFISQYCDLYNPDKVIINFVGGEPLLRPRICADIIKKLSPIVPLYTSTTTNLTLPLCEDSLEFISLLNDVYVSIDGDNQQHNSQRIPLTDIDPYENTNSNLETLIDKGFASKLNLKAALKDEYITKESYEYYLTKYSYMGIDLEKIHFGCLHPTEHIKSSYNEMVGFAHNLKIAFRERPCCKYRATSYIQIEPSGNIYDVPFKWAKNLLGNLDQTFDEIVTNRIKIIEDEFVCFKDEKCMSCPVLGYCWGGCVTGIPLHKNKPSDYCDQERLIKQVDLLAKSGEIIKIPLPMV
jgi:radical SAM protein with 4Fe4S-binding SPASM domain